MIPLSVPNFEGNELKYVTDAVAQGWVSTGGAYIVDFEKKLAEYVGVQSAVACQSGTSAIHLALIESGVTADDAVIVPTLTFIAAVNPVKYCGAEPIFMDCDDSLCMDTAKLEEFCQQECVWDTKDLIHRQTGKKIKAVLVVHVFGNMADMERIMDIAAVYNLRVIEDATEALGTRYEEGRYAGKYAGSIGDFGTYSFNGNKIITTGGGGMVVARNQEELKHIGYLATQAKDDPLFYIHDEVGYNYRMTNVQAAIGVGQIELLPEFVERKNKNYDLYKQHLDGDDRFELLAFRSGTFSNKWFYALYIKSDVDVKALVNKFADNGIQTRTIWGLINEQKPYTQDCAYRIEKAKEYSQRIINLPCSTNLTTEEILKVCETVKQIL